MNTHPSVSAGTRYEMTCAVAAQETKDAQLRIVARAIGKRAHEVQCWGGGVRDRQTTTLQLDMIPEDCHALVIIVQRHRAFTGTLTLTHLSLVEADGEKTTL